jgi:DNA-binding IclR family transcriptional regulator
MRKSTGRSMFEAMQLMTAQQMALSNPQAPQKQETPLTPEQRAAKARQENMNGWAELNARWKKEAAENAAKRYSSSSS